MKTQIKIYKDKDPWIPQSYLYLVFTTLNLKLTNTFPQLFDHTYCFIYFSRS